MTREESRKYLIDISYALGNMSIEYLTEKDGDKMREAIKALEQEPVLDKIRAEIGKLPDLNPDYEMDKTIHVSKWAVFEIIDKYKAESETKE